MNVHRRSCRACLAAGITRPTVRRERRGLVMSTSYGSPATTAVAAFDAETDRADASVVEVTLLWGDSTLAVRHLASGETLSIGDGDDCDLLMAGAAEPVRIEH